MSEQSYVRLPDRGILSVSGPDVTDFLQGLISQDIGKVTATQSAYGALLTPQGKYLHDFLIVRMNETILLDCEAARRQDLMVRLRRYRLRSKVEITDDSDSLKVFAIFGGEPASLFGLVTAVGASTAWDNGFVYQDPRQMALGCRAVLPADNGGEALRALGLTEAPFAAYDEHRAKLGVPDGSRDLQIEKSTLLEANIDTFNGIDWDKGCYVGQELTARTKHRGLLKRRLRPVRISQKVEPGTPVTSGDSTVGEVRSVAGHQALALLRHDAANADLRAGAATLALEPEVGNRSA